MSCDVTSGTPKSRRNLRALFVLGFVVSSVASVGGGLILVLAYPRPEVTRPMWEFGQILLFQGVVNLTIYGGLYWQFRRLASTA
jgi:hypothetical protein